MSQRNNTLVRRTIAQRKTSSSNSQQLPLGAQVGADPDFAKYFAKYALPAGREKFPEISPVWGLELHQTP